MYKDKKVTLLIPALNEEESIPRVIQEVPRDIVDEIIVIDNGSSDNTASRAAKSGAKVVREGFKGYGAACLKGLTNIGDTDIVVIMDADYSDYPGQIVRLVGPIAEGGADFVIGSRILGRRQTGAITPPAYWGNKLAAFLINLFFHYRFTDIGPFRAIKYESLKNLNMQDKNFGWNVEMQIKAIKSGLKIKEVPVDYRRRIGTSKISGTFSGIIKAGFKMIYTILKLVRVSLLKDRRGF